LSLIVAPLKPKFLLHLVYQKLTKKPSYDVGFPCNTAVLPMYGNPTLAKTSPSIEEEVSCTYTSTTNYCKRKPSSDNPLNSG
jgi:hypothetical protein